MTKRPDAALPKEVSAAEASIRLYGAVREGVEQNPHAAVGHVSVNVNLCDLAAVLSALSDALAAAQKEEG